MDETQRTIVERWALSVSEAGVLLGISRAHAYRMVASGELPSVRFGHRTLVPVDRLRALLDGSPAVPPTTRPERRS